LDEECGEYLTWLKARVKKCAFLINTYQEAGNKSAQMFVRHYNVPSSLV